MTATVAAKRCMRSWQRAPRRRGATRGRAPLGRFPPGRFAGGRTGGRAGAASLHINAPLPAPASPPAEPAAFGLRSARRCLRGAQCCSRSARPCWQVSRRLLPPSRRPAATAASWRTKPRRTCASPPLCGRCSRCATKSSSGATTPSNISRPRITPRELRRHAAGGARAVRGESLAAPPSGPSQTNRGREGASVLLHLFQVSVTVSQRLLSALPHSRAAP